MFISRNRSTRPPIRLLALVAGLAAPSCPALGLDLVTAEMLRLDDTPGGLTLVKAGADIKVADVADGSSASAQGVRPGYYLLSVGGKKVEDLTVAEVHKLFADAGGSAQCVFVTPVGERTVTLKLTPAAEAPRNEAPRPQPPRDEPPPRRAEPVANDPGVRAAPMTPSIDLSNDPLAGLLPGWRDVGVPAWVKPGVRITMYSAGASVVQSYYKLVEDPNGPYLDKATGKRYRRSDTALNKSDIPPGNPGASGDGVVEIDILASDGRNVAITSAMYGINRATNPITLSYLPVGGWITPGAFVPGVWVHPDLLNRLEDLRLDGVQIVRGPYPLGGKVYNSISFDTSGGGASSSYTYDLETGILLWSSQSTEGRTQTIHLHGEAPPKENNNMSLSTCANLRLTSMLGRDGTNPEWTRRQPTLSYRGVFNFTNPAMADTGSVTAPMNVSVRITRAGDRWAFFEAQSLIDIPGMPRRASSQGLCGPSGAYWIDPAALAGVRPGQVIDEDPVTTWRVEVAEVGRLPTGREVVTILSRGPGTTTGATYDKLTGVALMFASRTTANGESFQLELEQLP